MMNATRLPRVSLVPVCRIPDPGLSRIPDPGTP